jgi:hypothetical protein
VEKIDGQNGRHVDHAADAFEECRADPRRQRQQRVCAYQREEDFRGTNRKPWFTRKKSPPPDAG